MVDRVALGGLRIGLGVELGDHEASFSIAARARRPGAIRPHGPHQEVPKATSASRPGASTSAAKRGVGENPDEARSHSVPRPGPWR